MEFVINSFDFPSQFRLEERMRSKAIGTIFGSRVNARLKYLMTNRVRILACHLSTTKDGRNAHVLITRSSPGERVHQELPAQNGR